MELERGWLRRVFYEVDLETAMWSKTMREQAGIKDSDFSQKVKKEAARILRARADELDPQ